MSREQLMASLTDLKDCYIVPNEAREKLHMTKGRHFSANYSVEEDSRIEDLFDYQSTSNKGFDNYLLHVAYAVVASMEAYYIRVPSRDQMRNMLKISGYSAAEMKEFIWKQTTPGITGITVKSKATTIYLLTRVLADMMTDRDGWKLYKKGKKRKNIQKGQQAQQAEIKSMQKLKALVDYMEKESLLTFGESTDEEHDAYVDFIISHAKPLCTVRICRTELEELHRAGNKYIDQREQETDREIDRITRMLAKQSRNKPNQRNTSKLPLANPNTSMPQMDNLFVHKNELNPELIQPDLLLSSATEEYLPPEAREKIRNLRNEYKEVTKINDECCDRAKEISKEVERQQDMLVLTDYTPDIAVGAFQAILNGDDIFRLNISIPIMDDFFKETNLPCFGTYGIELDDDDEWDSVCPELNGRLGLSIVEEDDMVSVPEYGLEDAKTTVPLSSLISRFSRRTFEAPLYIRKSIMKQFKQCGFSDRKARDYALIVAVLDSVLRSEAEDYHVMSEYPDEREADLQQDAIRIDELVDQRLADERNARKQAEQDLKQARRENQTCRHEISSLQKENAALRKELDKYKGKTGNKDGTADDNDNDAGAEDTTAGAIERFEFPYHTKLKVVLYGGFDVFHQEIQKYLPDLRIVEVSAHIDVAPIRNADIVFLQINKTNHSNYWTVCDACKNSNVPYFHLNYASAKRCAKFMVEEISKLEDAQESVNV